MADYEDCRIILQCLIEYKQRVLNGEPDDDPDAPSLEECDALITKIRLVFPGIQPTTF